MRKELKISMIDWDSLRTIKIKKRKQLKILYRSLSEHAQEFFHKLYGNSIDNIPPDKLRRAIEQCQYTINKNIQEIEKTFIRIK